MLRVVPSESGHVGMPRWNEKERESLHDDLYENTERDLLFVCADRCPVHFLSVDPYSKGGLELDRREEREIY